MKYTHLFFDLDGTVIDSSSGITASVAYALKGLDRTPPPKEELLCFIGPPLEYGFSAFCGLDKRTAKQAVALYRENYRAGAMLDCRVYDGMEQLLRKASEAGLCCVLATCKPHVYADAILHHHGLSRYFSFVSGPELDGTRGEKHQVIEYAIQQLGIADRRSILMLGDRQNDVEGAKRCGVDCAGVLWGFGSSEELRTAGATLLFEKPSEAERFLL